GRVWTASRWYEVRPQRGLQRICPGHLDTLGFDPIGVVQQSKRARNLIWLERVEFPSVASTMRAPASVLSAVFLFVAMGRPSLAVAQTSQTFTPAAQSDAEKHAMLDRVIANQKKNDQALDIYERLERKESRKSPAGTLAEIKISRVVPAGTGVDHIPVGPDGKPTDANAYRTELEKLERSLAWAAEDGRAQRDAYDKIAKKQKDHAELIEATRSAFLYTFVGREPRGDRMLSKYRMDPNPAYQPTS